MSAGFFVDMERKFWQYSDMKDKIYNLINTETNKIISRNHKFNKSEASKFNYAFSLNGVAKKYVPC